MLIGGSSATTKCIREMEVYATGETGNNFLPAR